MVRLSLAVLLLALSVASASAQTKPIVAVFPIQDRAQRLSEDQIGQLTDYFGVKLTESGGFIVVPRADLEAALRAAKVQSYASCVDESCQIEIGKELAAQKVVHTQVVQVGDNCAVTSTLFDLRLSATERAASEKGGCDPNALVEQLESVARKLGGESTAVASKPETPTAAPSAPAPAPAAPTWALRVEAEPSGADVLLDGKRIGGAPQTVQVEKGRTAELAVEAEGYEPYSERVSLERDERRAITLRMGEVKKRSRTEWFGGSFAGGVGMSGAIDFGVWVRLFNMHFGAFTLTPVETFLGLTLSDETSKDSTSGFVTEGSSAVHFFVGPRAGYKITFASDHNLELSLGGGLMIVTETDDEITAMALAPSIRYLFLGDGAFSWGIALRGMVPLASKSCDNFLEENREDLIAGGALAAYVACRNHHPIFVQLEIPLGGYF